MKRIIWQYWETRGKKPAHIDHLHRFVEKNSGVNVKLVTPENLHEYLDDVPQAILEIHELAHKADMLRTMLVAKHGGMWLDSDALVLRDLNPYFDLLESNEFIGFNNGGKLGNPPPYVRVNCFLSRANGTIVSEWVRGQHAKLPRTQFTWREIGSEILHPLCRKHRENVLILPFEEISPIRWNEWQLFLRSDLNAQRISEQCRLLMVNFPSQVWQNSEIMSKKNLLSELHKKATNINYKISTGKWPLNSILGLFMLRLIMKFQRYILWKLLSK